MQSDDSSTHDAQTLDSATADQAKEQEKANFPDTYSGAEDDDSEMKTAFFDDKEEVPVSGFFFPSSVCVCQLIVCVTLGSCYCYFLLIVMF